MAVNLSPIGGVAAQFFDNSGNVLSGGKIFTYAAGTTTPQATYTSSNGATAHANPIILDAAGRVPTGEIWLTDGLQYKFIIKTSTDVQIGSYDNLVGINSNFVNYTNSQEIQTATTGQTVFTLTTMAYQPGTHSLSVFVDGLNQYGPGATYAYEETSDTVVTFNSGLPNGASVKFTTSVINATSYADAEQIGYVPPFTNSVATNLENKSAQIVSVKDFGAVGDGVTDDYAAILAAVAYINSKGSGTLVFPNGTYFIDHFINTNPASPNGIQDFTFANCNGLVIDGQGSTVQMKGGWVMTNDYSIGPFNYSYKRSVGFYFNFCDNLEIRNFNVNGGAATITKGAGLNAENVSYGIGIRACHGVNCIDVTAKYCCTDGLYLNSASSAPGSRICENVNFTRCQFTNNARQGLSVIQLRYGTFTECIFENTGAPYTGTFGGFAPSAGVDIEPDLSNLENKTGDITFVSCSFANNAGNDFICSSATSTPYPINFFGCYFGTTDASTFPAVIFAGKYGKFYACFFENESILPNFSFSYETNPSQVELYGCLFRNSDPDQSAILYVPGGVTPNTKLVVDNCSFYFNAPTPKTAFRIYIQDSPTKNTVVFTNNEIFISAAEHAGVTFDVAFLLQNVLRSTGNTWKTDLTTASKVFTVSYNSAVNINDYYQNNTYISPATSAWPSQIYSPTTQQFGVLQDATSQITQRYGSAAPTTGTWARGDIVYATTPTSGSHIGWVCTVAGTPGTWNTFGLIS